MIVLHPWEEWADGEGEFLPKKSNQGIRMVLPLSGILGRNKTAATQRQTQGLWLNMSLVQVTAGLRTHGVLQ